MKAPFIAAALAACLSTVAVADQRTVIMGTEGAYPPFNSIDSNGKLVGFDIEIGDALCEAAQFQCEWVTNDWDGIIPGLLAKKYDTILASMSITEERKEQVAFTGKYYTTPARFVVEASAAGSVNGDDLNASFQGKTVAVQSSTIHQNFVTDMFDDGVKIKAYDTAEAAYLDLAAGRVDAFFGDSVGIDDGFLKTEQGQGYVMDGPSYSDVKYFGDGAGIAIRKEDTDLVEAFNAAIAEIRANGTYAAIQAKYFDFDVYGD